MAEEVAPTEEVAEEPAVEEQVATLPLDGWVIGYLPGSLQDPVRLSWSEALEKTIKDAGGEIISIDSEFDVAKQVSDGEDILAQDIDILVINPNDADAMVPIVEKSNEMGIPVVCIDRTVSGGNIVTTVEFDNWKGGYEAGEFIAGELNNKGKVLHIQGTLGASVVYERGESFRQALAKYEDIEIVGEPASEFWSAEDGLAFTEDTLTVHPDLGAIWAHADCILIGAYQAVEAAGKLDQVVMVGMNFFAGIPEIIKEGKGRVYTWATPTEDVGNATGEVCIKIAQGKTSEIEEITGTPIIWVDKDNVEQNWQYKLD